MPQLKQSTQRGRNKRENEHAGAGAGAGAGASYICCRHPSILSLMFAGQFYYDLVHILVF